MKNNSNIAGDIIEYALEFIFGIGTGFLVNKASKKIYEPDNLYEKVLMGIGTMSISTAVGYGAGRVIHDITHREEKRKEQELIDCLLELNNQNMELSRGVMKSSKLIIDEGNLILKAVDFNDGSDEVIDFHNFKNNININEPIDISMSELLKNDREEEDDE